MPRNVPAETLYVLSRPAPPELSEIVVLALFLVGHDKSERLVPPPTGRLPQFSGEDRGGPRWEGVRSRPDRRARRSRTVRARRRSTSKPVAFSDPGDRNFSGGGPWGRPLLDLVVRSLGGNYRKPPRKDIRGGYRSAPACRACRARLSCACRARRSRTDRARRSPEEGREGLRNALTRTFVVGKAGFEPATSASRMPQRRILTDLREP